MKKQLTKMIAAIMIVALVATSCQKEETISPSVTKNVKNTQLRGSGEQIDPQLPLNEEMGLLSEDEPIHSIVLNSPELTRIQAQGGHVNNARILRFGDPKKVFVFVPDNDSTPPFNPNLPSKTNGWVIGIYGNSIVSSFGFTADHNGNTKPFSGTLEIRNLDGDVLVEAEIENLKKVWVRHGGHGTWVDCFQHNSSEWWAIVGYVLSPVPTLVGIAIGCL